ncbi:uncharacterized protein LAJ45_11176 [Morchella importuna]|uniref:uncharacterized protein n=1 Tax=Morchella importuna TaxID=1174673 RepID=UPI001E8E0A5E|nr:uncharacterized protein LAJ45_11176 [Morchella importuna]KAH8144839.1 hypothetical protein LAJ45_11176 [Morchella importuna]
MSETTFGPQLLPHNNPPQLQILISNLSHNIPITVFLNSNPSLPDAFETKLISAWPNLPESARNSALQKILRTIQAHYPVYPPRFSLSPFLHTLPGSGELVVEEKIDPRLIQKLQLPEEIIPENTCTKPKLYPISSLHSCPLSQSSPRSWSSHIQLVTLSPASKKKYIAKGPTNNFSELRNLLSLPPHPNIISPPHGLITVSPTDHRVVGFLLEYYPHGNLDHLCSTLTPRPPPERLWSWGHQLVNALHWLHIEQKSFHGDIKPDNIIVHPSPSGEERLVLIDFSQDESTAATAPPEAKGGFPRTWSGEALERADVYALGRTLYILTKGLSMNELYMELFRDINFVYKTDLEGIDGPIRDVVEMCTRRDPAERPGLGELKKIFEGGDEGKMKMGLAKRQGWSVVRSAVKIRVGMGKKVSGTARGRLAEMVQSVVCWGRGG